MNKGGVTADGKELVKVLPTGNIQISKEMMAEEKALIEDAFLVNLFQLALNLKDLPQMTATQVIEITNQKGILLAPTVGNQEEDLGHMIDRELDVAMAIGAFRNYPMPPRLREANGAYSIVYTSPLSKAAALAKCLRLHARCGILQGTHQHHAGSSHLDWADLDVAMPEMPTSAALRPRGQQAMSRSRRNGSAAPKRCKSSSRSKPHQRKRLLQKAAAVQFKAGMTSPAQAPAQGGPPLAQQVQGA